MKVDVRISDENDHLCTTTQPLDVVRSIFKARISKSEAVAMAAAMRKGQTYTATSSLGITYQASPAQTKAPKTTHFDY